MFTARSPNPYVGISVPCFIWIFSLLMLAVPRISGAASAVTLSSATWKTAGNQLSVSGRYAASLNGQALELTDTSGRVLASGTASNGSFQFNGAVQQPELLCNVRLRIGSNVVSRKVTGISSDSCAKAPQCKILSPANGTSLVNGADVRFQASAQLKDNTSSPLRVEWDFGGGAMGIENTSSRLVTTYRHPQSAVATVKFVRDNSRYRVRFTAIDKKNHYCEDAIEVTVGSPPVSPPGVAQMAATAINTAPASGSGLNGNAGELVVLPYEEWTMQSDHDMRIIPNAYVSMSPTAHNLSSVVYEKGHQPKVVGADSVQLRYTASSNRYDPAGQGSINTTSQNWPLNGDVTLASALADASIQKTDFWEKYLGRPQNEKSPDYYISSYWMAFGSTYPFSGLPEPVNPQPDEGYIIGRGQSETLDGSFMPGKNAPYTENAPQKFGHFNPVNGEFAARLLPYTDIDDTGRVNPLSLLRVDATKDGKVVAATDGVVNASRDFHCRGCHAKGKIAANPQTPFKPSAYASSASGKWTLRNDYGYAADPTAKPAFHEASSDSLWDQEYAAMKNYTSLHSFYNNDMLYNVVTKGTQRDANGRVEVDAPVRCIGCHSSGMASEPSNFNEGWWSMENFDVNSAAYDPLYSIAMHRFHGELQWNKTKTDILRDETGRFVRWDWKKNGRNTQSLFPTIDGKGNNLPMEENCLKCHAGHREPQFRDRMYTAGRTCFDCHGDMLAVGEAFPKNYPENKAKLGSSDLNNYRITWFDEPDCASCHTGNGNVGKTGTNGYFSAGVMKRAFRDSDLSATPRQVDRSKPDTARFSAAPQQNYQTTIPISITGWDPATDGFPSQDSLLKIDTPLYRNARDAHGNVPCAACHGSSHAIWPNRDPKSNDNVTANQLQGHAGPIAECSVCHAKEAFTQTTDLDGGRYSGLADNSGVLGGPHNMHPVNDPNWWLKTRNDSWGGLHDNFSQMPGRNGEDQCAACHGNDHKGTRLSKASVDRELTLWNGKKVKWKAGEPVGCSGCHSIAVSFAGTPKGGGGSTGGEQSNHMPVISSAPKKGLNVGEDYSYQIVASDADGDALTYSLQTPPEGMTINASTGSIQWTAPVTGGSFSFVIVVSDGKTNATQLVSLTVCPPPSVWDAMGMCH